MRALKFPLVLALSMVVFSAIGFAGCSSNSTPNGGTGGAGGGVAGSTGSGGAQSGTGGSTGSGGRVDAGSDTRTAAGGATGQDGGAGKPNCTALLACCDMAPAGMLKTACMGQYNTANAQGDSACASTLEIIRGYGVCN